MIPFLEHIFNVGIAASVAVGLLFAIAFLRHKRESRRANRILAALLVVLSLSVILNSILHLFIPRSYPHLWTFPEPFLLLIGPLFYYYIQALSSFVAKGKLLFHFAPALLVAICFILFISTDEASLRWRGLWHLSGLLWLAIYVHFWIYYFANRRALGKFRERLKQSRSSIEEVHQAWISYCLTALLICYSILGLLFLLAHGAIFLPVNQALAVVLAGMIYGIGYRTLNRPEIFAELPLASARSADGEGEEHFAKKKKSGLSASMVSHQLHRVEQFLTRQKPYRDPDLDLDSLAEMLQLSSHHLSQVINSGAQRNFYDFVNHYRAEEAKALLANPKNDYLTILSIAFDAGFNSKATFNRFFKRVTQQTPSEFRKLQRGSG